MTNNNVTDLQKTEQKDPKAQCDEQKELKENLQASHEQLRKLEEKLLASQKELHRSKTNVAPWWPRLILAVFVIVGTGVFIMLAACGVLTTELNSWLDLASFALILAAWCSTVWAAFWYTRTLR